MKFVTVDNNKIRLNQLTKKLKNNFPNCTVVEFIDPMLAAKFIFNSEVNIVFAQEEMERVTGEDLKHVIRLIKPLIQVILFYDLSEVDAYIIKLKNN